MTEEFRRYPIFNTVLFALFRINLLLHALYYVFQFLSFCLLELARHTEYGTDEHMEGNFWANLGRGNTAVKQLV